MINKPEGLYRLGSYRYFRATLTSSVQRRQQPLFYVLLSFFAGFIVMYTTATSYCFVSLLMALFALVTFSASLIVGEYLRNTPSLATLMPVSERKKLIYRFTSSLYMLLRTILIIAAALAVIFVILMIVFGIVSAVNGGNAGTDSSGESVSVYLQMGKYGAIFSVAFVIICFSAGVISGYFKKSKNRNMFLLCFILSVILAFILTGLPYALAHSHVMSATHAVTEKIVSPFIEACYADMSLPWLCSLLWCLAAAGSLTAAVIIGIKKMKSSEF